MDPRGSPDTLVPGLCRFVSDASQMAFEVSGGFGVVCPSFVSLTVVADRSADFSDPCFSYGDFRYRRSIFDSRPDCLVRDPVGPQP